MQKQPTLEDLERELARQDAELAACADLAASIPQDVRVDLSELMEFDEVVEPRERLSVRPIFNGLRA